MEQTKLRTIFITGCSSGIGLISATALKKRGYRVITSCRKESDQRKLIEQGFECILLDLDNPQSVNRAAQEVLALTEGKLFALFNNAGFGLYGRLNTMNREQLESQFSTNFFAVHQLTQLLLPAMLSQNTGRIIQTSSIVGIIATPGRGAYSASKYALEAWSDVLRLELSNTNIKVCLIEPGPLNTHFSNNVNQTEKENIVKNPPIAKRFTLPPEAILPYLFHALEHPKPKIRYRVTKVTKIAAIAKRLLPDRLMDKILKNK
ncbi:SDR family oxidoreductase [Gilliamella sp. B2776]|uniref:SDR family oxidoreductase n=1 Tax=unclassified Gilliamella TaxID=2685620 RepID=UPI00226A05CD|nr:MULTISPECIES: SDR family oxidoreductase [unclassified Gilliamella]MCX8650839.1 SDR family oxidoreductase [Gilliamella sp. B2779]MCX8653981.1 SDR family oxidoreductase [Gilliamella sp. B2737]MCX8665905.1 SDR family oxidoreductase [Gilliamella sp. B2887]MCX8691466.1 SDR family oxidoreductase [Gilliamella sp. B2776]MCX8698638.1 SDR family oxidoreductase [Gilliamella sp. B3000]